MLNIKGIVHQKWKFCHYLFTLKLFHTCEFLSYAILKNVCNQCAFLVLVGIHSIFSHTMEVNGDQRLFLHRIFKISSFVFNRRNKLIQTYNNLRVSLRFFFGEEYYLKFYKKKIKIFIKKYYNKNNMYNPDGLAMHYAYSKVAINQAIIILGVYQPWNCTKVTK